jgi:uncharacterized protein YwgA
MSKINSAKDLIMLLLYAKGHKGVEREPIVGRTRLMKMIFLFDKEIRKQFNLGGTISDEAFPDFRAYDYGPFSDQVYSELEFLVDTGFVKPRSADVEEDAPEEALEYEYWQANSNVDNGSEMPKGTEQFELTDVGRSFVEDELIKSFSKDQWQNIERFKVRCTGMPLKAMLRYVYAKYPATTVKSKIKDSL